MTRICPAEPGDVVRMPASCWPRAAAVTGSEDAPADRGAPAAVLASLRAAGTLTGPGRPYPGRRGSGRRPLTSAPASQPRPLEGRTMTRTPAQADPQTDQPIPYTLTAMADALLDAEDAETSPEPEAGS